MTDAADRIIRSRAELLEGKPRVVEPRAADEGGCGVTGFACSIPVRGRHIYEPSVQMHNRGNGKGGGIAAAGLVAEDVGVSQEVLDSHYLLQIALLDPKARAEVEEAFIAPYFDVALSTGIADDRRLSRRPGPGGPAAGRAALPRAREAGGADGIRGAQRAGGPAAARR